MVCIDDFQCEEFIGGAAGLDESALIVRHLDGCEPCRHRLESVRRNLETFALLRSHSQLIFEDAAFEDTGFETIPGAPATQDRFEIIREIGRGGMGVVFEARQCRPDRPVALKVLNAQRANDPRCRALFEIEARALATLRHPSIATVYDAGFTGDGDPYLAMELVRGASFDAFIRDENPARRERMDIFRLVAHAIAEAHRGGVVHGDLKPANIIIVDRDETMPRLRRDWSPDDVRIIDFGLARFAESTKSDDTPARHRIAGTIPYMSPEQARGGSDGPEPASDVYALGAILYEMLTGAPPHALDGLSFDDALHRIAVEDARAPSSRDPSINRDLDAIVTMALARDLERRYSTAGALAEDVDRYLTHHPIVARRARPLERAVKFCRRHPLPVAATVACMLILGLGLFASLWQANVASRARDDAEDRLDRIVSQSEYLIDDLIQRLNRTLGAGEVALGAAEEIHDFFESIGPSHQDRLEVQRGWWSSKRLLAGLLHQRGEFDLALALMRQSHALVEEAVERFPDEEFNFSMAYSLQHLARSLRGVGAVEEADDCDRMALDWYARDMESDPDNAVHRSNFAAQLGSAALRAAAQGDLDGAQSFMIRSADEHERAVALAPDDPYIRHRAIQHLLTQSRIWDRLEESEQARADALAALTGFQALRDLAPENPAFIESEAICRLHMARLMLKAADPAAAAEHAAAARDNFSTLHESAPDVPRYVERRDNAQAVLEEAQAAMAQRGANGDDSQW